MNTKKAFFNWSGGKDSALALYHILKTESYTVQELLTTVSLEYNRISMHGVRIELLIRQAKELNIELNIIRLAESAGMDLYNELMNEAISYYKSLNCSFSIFGDIFLADLRKYREKNLAKVDMTAVFPLWKRDTNELIHEFINLGFKAVTVAVNAQLLDESFAGRIIDKQFIADLPDHVDPCGENGEFHSFVFDGPIFQRPIPIKIEKITKRTYTKSNDDQSNWNTDYYFCDIILDN